MADAEQAIKALKGSPHSEFVSGDGLVSVDVTDIVRLLEKQVPRVMSWKEIIAYLRDDDGDKQPIWMEWKCVPGLNGWTLAYSLKDLANRYKENYNVLWRPWTSKPSKEKREAEAWK